ncbi:putative GNAT domain-containing protein [Seiridium cardinale]|uniref:GNAT domain-containing protein n=1 Tax=Seiridium cardinale TaxID=138064 RepID=A0ABR2X6S1_9PEZI
MTTITVSTSLPFFKDDMIQLIETQRLIIRPLLHPKDLEAYRTIRSQPEAMTSSSTGLPDATLEQTEAKLKRLQPPYYDSHVYFGIFLKKSDASEGDFIGDGGVHKIADTETGWPEFGYKFKKEYWGLGYATEFAKAFMGYWWNEIPRNQREISILASSLKNPHELEPVEQDK